jgi:hypothetical protein
MVSRNVKILTALIATSFTVIFVFGLAHSISTGFAGFKGGLPFWIISIIVMGAAVYDFWYETVRKKSND